jgi:prepilin signal peptidase PulO-like enzyme (type II secretory pathway)
VGQYEYSPRARLIIGTLLGAGGLAMAVAVFRTLLTVANPLQDQSMAGFLMGLLLLFAGISIAQPPGVGFRQYLCGALAITVFALLFDWIAFMPGARDFHTGASSLRQGAQVNSSLGRVAFGGAAVIFDLFALHAWRVTIRLLVTRSTTRKAAPTPE